MILVTVTLSDWIFRSVVSRSVLTLSRDYFRLRKPLERRVYEIARKHCGRQAEWKIGLETLLKKTGSTSPRRVFRRMIRDIAEEDGLPDYRLSLDGGDIVFVRPRPGAFGARSGRRGRGRCWARARTRRRGRSAPGRTCMRSRPTGGGSGPAPGGRGSAARTRPSSPSCGPAPRAADRAFRARNARQSVVAFRARNAYQSPSS